MLSVNAIFYTIHNILSFIKFSTLLEQHNSVNNLEMSLKFPFGKTADYYRLCDNLHDV